MENLAKNKNCQKIYDDGISESSVDDDNQFSIAFYNWKERAEIIDVDTIHESILKANEVENQNKKSNTKDFLISKIILQVNQEILRLYNRNDKYKFDTNSFYDDMNVINSDPKKMPECVKAYRKARNIPNDKPIYTKKTIMKKIRTYEKLSPEAKELYLNKELGNWGGLREILRKVNEETLRCLITLVLDFPTLSTTSYTTYLNSKYGPNYSNNISVRTVERYLNSIGFKIKRASFAPPNRNSIGLRIFRVAWCKIIEDILKEKNVLFGFIDEAAITTCEGKNHGRAFEGITPLINCPLSKVKMSVIAIVFPGFGVLYKIIENSTSGEQYSQFLKEAIEFTRKYICNYSTEIVIIEDNCPMHNTENVENTIKELNIALLPTVQYSPALNGVIEGYFGIVKSHIFIDATTQGDYAIKDSIEKEWEYSTLQYFGDAKSIQLFREWRTRMQECEAGMPLFSKHVTVNNNFDDEIEKQLQVYVDRYMNQIEHQINFK